MIYYLFMGIFIIITSIFVLKNCQIVYLLFKLGFNFDVIKFMVVELLMVALVITIFDSFGFTKTSFVISSFILGMLIPAVFETTQKRNPQRSTKRDLKNSLQVTMPGVTTVGVVTVGIAEETVVVVTAVEVVIND